MTTDANQPWSPGSLLLGEYRVERPLGEGGMGQVYLVQSRSTGQRFAVKRAHPGDPAARRRLLAELQTWIDLPEHPHLVACRFFRTAGAEVVLFTDHVAGGSLAEWIQQRRLSSIEPILDVAIQLAWGLHAAHQHGVVHQDVKPGNVLLTPEGLARVTDFGLARASEPAGQAPFGGSLTRPYCSPEQAELAANPRPEARLTLHTDLWSWAVTVLEMFVGEPPCRYGGHLAGEILESILRRGGRTEGLPRLPDLLAVVLRKCFQRRPEERWASMADVASVVKVAYQLATGQCYPRPEPPATQRGPAIAEHSRRTFGGSGWDDPRFWLDKALQAAGRNPAKALVGPRTGSRKAQAVADLAAYDEAHRLLAGMVAGGRRDLAPLLAELSLAKALVHEAADDLPGMAELYAQAAELLGPLVAGGRDDLAADLVQAHRSHAGILSTWGRYQEAVELCDRALEVCTAHGAPQERRPLGTEFVLVCRDKGQALAALGDYHAALALYERAQVVCEALVRHDGRDDFRRHLAGLYVSKARALKDLGERAAAAAWLDQALPMYEQLVEAEGERGLCHALASACMTRANLLTELGDRPAAIALYDRVIIRWRQQVEQEDWPHLSADLATACMNKANLLSRQQNEAEALALYDEALAIYERLTGPGGQQELIPYLVCACINKAVSLRVVGDLARAVEVGQRALDLLEPLVVGGGRTELAPELARAQLTQARSLAAVEQAEAALACAGGAALLYEQLVQGQGRWELGGELMRACHVRAMLAASQGQQGAAVEFLDRAVTLGEQLAQEKDQPDLHGELMTLRVDRAEVLIDVGLTERARGELCEVIALLEARVSDEEIRRRAERQLERTW